MVLDIEKIFSYAYYCKVYFVLVLVLHVKVKTKAPLISDLIEYKLILNLVAI